MSKVQVDTIDTRSGTSTMQIGSTNTSTINIGVSGDTVNIPSGVTIANAGTATGFGESNTPYFLAYTASSTQSIAHDTWTTVACANALLNDGSDFNTSTYKFTPQVAGKYFLFAAAAWNGDGGTNSQYTIKKNNTESVTTQRILKIYSDSNARGGNINAFFEANGSSDYFTFQAYQSSGGAKNLLGTNGGENNYFGGFLVAT